jgi:HEAT repeat protein
MAPTPGNPGPIGTPGLSGTDVTAWTFWWEFNKQRFLQLKAHLDQTGELYTDESDGLLGNKGSHRDSMRVTTEQIASDVFPALKAALEKETNRDVITGSLVALAKVGHESKITMSVFEKFLASREQEVAETAALAYGILAAPEGISTLHDLFADSASGRALVGNREVPFRTRTFAAYGLGLTGARTNDPDVRAQIQGWLTTFLAQSSRIDTRDIRVATVVSLGLIPDSSGKVVAALGKYFEANRKNEDAICAHVPNAIARILKDASVDERKAYCDMLVGELSKKSSRKDSLTRASMAQALGMLTKVGDPHANDVTAILRDKIDNELSKNVQLGYFGLIALGQIAGTGEPGNDVEKYLLDKAMVSGGRVMGRAWAALALGLAGFDQLAQRKVPNPTMCERLEAQMMDIKDPQQRSAFAIGLGLMRHSASAPAIESCLDSVKDDTYRGYFATALGLMGQKSAIAKIAGLTKNATRRPDLLRETAISLGLLGDKKILDTLIGILGEKANVLAVDAALAMAIGTIGDYRAIQPLCAMLKDEKKERTSESRAFAAAALGIVCDKESYSWNFKISTDLNYTATTETLNDFASQTGILNLL